MAAHVQYALHDESVLSMQLAVVMVVEDEMFFFSQDQRNN